MRTRTKVILTCILGALFVAGLLLLILTSGDILDTYRWWLRVKDLETYNYTAYQFRNYIFYRNDSVFMLFSNKYYIYLGI